MDKIDLYSGRQSMLKWNNIGMNQESYQRLLSRATAMIAEHITKTLTENNNQHPYLSSRIKSRDMFEVVANFVHIPFLHDKNHMEIFVDEILSNLQHDERLIYEVDLSSNNIGFWLSDFFIERMFNNNQTLTHKLGNNGGQKNPTFQTNSYRSPEPTYQPTNEALYPTNPREYKSVVAAIAHYFAEVALNRISPTVPYLVREIVIELANPSFLKNFTCYTFELSKLCENVVNQLKLDKRLLYDRSKDVFWARSVNNISIPNNINSSINSSNNSSTISSYNNISNSVNSISSSDSWNRGKSTNSNEYLPNAPFNPNHYAPLDYESGYNLPVPPHSWSAIANTAGIPTPITTTAEIDTTIPNLDDVDRLLPLITTIILKKLNVSQPYLIDNLRSLLNDTGSSVNRSLQLKAFKVKREMEIVCQTLVDMLRQNPALTYDEVNYTMPKHTKPSPVFWLSNSAASGAAGADTTMLLSTGKSDVSVSPTAPIQPAMLPAALPTAVGNPKVAGNGLRNDFYDSPMYSAIVGRLASYFAGKALEVIEPKIAENEQTAEQQQQTYPVAVILEVLRKGEDIVTTTVNPADQTAVSKTVSLSDLYEFHHVDVTQLCFDVTRAIDKSHKPLRFVSVEETLELGYFTTSSRAIESCSETSGDSSSESCVVQGVEKTKTAAGALIAQEAEVAAQEAEIAVSATVVDGNNNSTNNISSGDIAEGTATQNAAQPEKLTELSSPTPKQSAELSVLLNDPTDTADKGVDMNQTYASYLQQYHAQHNLQQQTQQTQQMQQMAQQKQTSTGRQQAQQQQMQQPQELYADHTAVAHSGQVKSRFNPLMVNRDLGGEPQRVPQPQTALLKSPQSQQQLQYFQQFNLPPPFTQQQPQFRIQPSGIPPARSPQYAQLQQQQQRQQQLQQQSRGMVSNSNLPSNHGFHPLSTPPRPPSLSTAAPHMQYSEAELSRLFTTSIDMTDNNGGHNSNISNSSGVRNRINSSGSGSGDVIFDSPNRPSNNQITDNLYKIELLRLSNSSNNINNNINNKTNSIGISNSISISNPFHFDSSFGSGFDTNQFTDNEHISRLLSSPMSGVSRTRAGASSGSTAAPPRRQPAEELWESLNGEW